MRDNPFQSTVAVSPDRVTSIQRGPWLLQHSLHGEPVQFVLRQTENLSVYIRIVLAQRRLRSSLLADEVPPVAIQYTLAPLSSVRDEQKGDEHDHSEPWRG